jgi:hypothetical protein
VVETQDGVPEFEGKWGFGLDMELNIPVTRDLGYVVARGTLNAGFDPNPWSLQIGYTIPLSTLVRGLTGQTNNSTSSQ